MGSPDQKLDHFSLKSILFEIGTLFRNFMFCVGLISLAVMITDVTEYSGNIFKCDERFTLPTTSTQSYDCGLLAKKFLFCQVINSI
jgi:hypothetical protein